MGAAPIKNGMAEFVAQEEMDRSTGYWWSPDERHIAFARVDETPVKESQRFEISADNVETFPQRYPTAGGPNVLIRLGVSDIHTGAVTWIDLGSDPDIYLARVNWLPDGKTLAVQRESRDQRRLDLLFANVETGESRVVLTETSATWIDLNDELSFLHHSKEFVWASARDGFLHLYLYDYKDAWCGGSPRAPGWSMTSAPAPSRPSTRSIAGSISPPPRRARWSGSCTAPRSTRKIPRRIDASPEDRAYTA